MNQKHACLVWMDLEMTGLEPEQDHIIEIATLITDQDLNLIAEGPELAIFQSDEILESMNPWCIEHHGASGLTQRVRESNISLTQAEALTLDFVRQYVDQGQTPLCGNSIHQDKRFLIRYMPQLHDWFHYRNLDVSSFKEIAQRWYPEVPKFKKEEKHTAKEDILESVAELRYYREKIFR